MTNPSPEENGDQRITLIRQMRQLADEMEAQLRAEGALPPLPPPKGRAEREARRRWGMWPAVLLVGAGLTRLARDHPAAAAVVAAMAVPAAGLVIVASPAKVPLVGSSGRHDPGPARTVYVTPPVPRVTVTATPAPSMSPSPTPTPTPTPSPTPSDTSTPTPPPSPSPTGPAVPVPDSPAAAQPAPSTPPADGGGSGGGGDAAPEPDPPPSRSGPRPPRRHRPGPPPPAETPAHAYGVCVAGLRAPLPVHVSVRVLCRHSRGRP